jgi:hypothetical protein
MKLQIQNILYLVNFPVSFLQFDWIISYPCTGIDKPRGLQDFKVPRIFGQFAPTDGDAASLKHWLPLPPKKVGHYSIF